jgi:hypothetical protein
MAKIDNGYACLLCSKCQEFLVFQALSLLRSLHEPEKSEEISESSEFLGNRQVWPLFFFKHESVEGWTAAGLTWSIRKINF